jgi:hypothetical protein
MHYVLSKRASAFVVSKLALRTAAAQLDSQESPIMTAHGLRLLFNSWCFLLMVGKCTNFNN